MKKFYTAFVFLFLFSFAHAQDAPFITTWEVIPNALSITIPTTGTGYDYTIDLTMQTFEPPTVSGEDVLAFTATVTPNDSDYTPS